MARTVYEKSDTIPLIAEVLRELGYEGSSFSQITERTGISKGSLYHFFPSGKEEMAAEVLRHVDAWFVTNVYEPLERDAPREAIPRMWEAVLDYFRSGQRVCLVGAFALDETRDHFAASIQRYFARWIEALRNALIRAGLDSSLAAELAEDSVSGIQGALVLGRAMKETEFFSRSVRRMAQRMDAELSQHP